MNSTAPQQGWMSQARFDREYGAAGLDHDFGMQWGPHRNQRISPRLAPDATHGLLYAYDPLWNEYNLLATDVTLLQAKRAFNDLVTTVGYQGVGIDAFAAASWQARLTSARQPSIAPRSREFGVEL